MTTQNTMQDFTIRREGKPFLKFQGEIIGQGETEPSAYRGTKVIIFRTPSGNYVVQVVRFDRTVGSERIDGEAFSDVSSIIDWLRVDGGERTVGQASQQAIETACNKDENFKSAWIEIVQ